MKKLVAVILLISILALSLSSCSLFNEGEMMPDVLIRRTFENDEWLVVEDHLINKLDGKVYYLDLDDESTVPVAGHFQVHGSDVYKYEFSESSIKQYAFLEVHSNSFSEVVYYDAVITYDHEGKEIGRECYGEPLTEKQASDLYEFRVEELDTFRLYVLDVGYGYISREFGSVAKDDATEDEAMILGYIEGMHAEGSGDKGYYFIDGLGRPVGNEIRFCTAGTNRRDSIKADPIIKGVKKTEITAYDRETKSFRTVYEHDERKTQIIDFDENGAYLLSSSGKLSYVDFKTKAKTEIYEFTGIDLIVITDKYICVKYVRNGNTYLVYEKGGSVIANASALD